MAKRQQLDKSIKDAKTDLQETEWDQQISDIEQMMDDMKDDYSEFLSARLEDLEFIMNEMLSSANNNAGDIQRTLAEATSSVGTTLSDAMSNIWNSNSGLNGIVTNYSGSFGSAFTTTNATLDSIRIMIQSMVQEAQRQATGDTAMQQQMAQSVQPQQPSVSQTSQNQTTATTPQQTQNTGVDTGFFIYKASGIDKNLLNKENSIVDRLRYLDFDSSFSARAKYYNAMNYKDKYAGSASQNVKMLNWMKQNGFSTGGEITDLIGHTKDDGWALVGKKETIIDQQATQNLKDAIQMLNPLQNFINSMTSTVPLTSGTMSQNFENHIDVQMNFPNAKNYEEIKNALLVDNNFEKTMTQAILGGAMGQNSLKKRSMIK